MITGEFLAFLLLSIIAVSGGVLLLNLTNVVHMVLALVATFISIAGIYILLSAEFLAVVQILIYSGAITIIMLFGIMLTRPDKSSEVRQGGKVKETHSGSWTVQPGVEQNSPTAQTWSSCSAQHPAQRAHRQSHSKRAA